MMEKIKKLMKKKVLSKKDWNAFKGYMTSMVWAYPLNEYMELWQENQRIHKYIFPDMCK